MVQAGRDIQSDTFNGTGLVMGAILFLIVTIPLARLVDWLIAREQRRVGRGGSDDGGTGEDVTSDPALVGGGGVTT